MVNVILTKLVQTRLQGLSVGPNSPQTLSSLCLILSNELSPRLRIHIYFWSETVRAGFCTTQLSENLPVTNDSVETGVSPHACVPSSSSANKNISFAIFINICDVSLFDFPCLFFIFSTCSAVIDGLKLGLSPGELTFLWLFNALTCVCAYEYVLCGLLNPPDITVLHFFKGLKALPLFHLY